MEEKCKNSSIEKCLVCKTYECKNLYGPIKKDSRCYNMMFNKLFDECVFIGEPNGCARCEYMNACSTLIRECVVFMGT